MPGTGGSPPPLLPPAPPAAPHRCPVLAASAAPAECSGAEGRRCACLAARSLPSHLAGGAARFPPYPGHHRRAPRAHPTAPGTPPALSARAGGPQNRRGLPRERGFSPGRLQSTWQTGKQRQSSSFFIR